MALMPVADALAAILAGAEPLPEEMVALDAAYHRMLARDVAARRTQPPQAMSAMDGYAVRAADAADLSARLKVIGEVAAGRPFERKVGKGEAVRIFTGGVIPEGADAVIIQEDTGDRRRSHHHHRSRHSGAAYPPRRRRFPRGRRAAHARAPPHRPRFVARRRHELSGACGAPPPESRGARHRRRAGDAGRNPRPRPDRLFQRLRLAGAGARRGRRGRRSRDRRRHGRRHRARHPPCARGERGYPDHHGRRLGRRP